MPRIGMNGWIHTNGIDGETGMPLLGAMAPAEAAQIAARRRGAARKQSYLRQVWRTVSFPGIVSKRPGRGSPGRDSWRWRACARATAQTVLSSALRSADLSAPIGAEVSSALGAP